MNETLFARKRASVQPGTSLGWDWPEQENFSRCKARLVVLLDILNMIPTLKLHVMSAVDSFIKPILPLSALLWLLS